MKDIMFQYGVVVGLFVGWIVGWAVMLFLVKKWVGDDVGKG